jgi:hypothetical protein
VKDFAERLRLHDGTADELEWPANLPCHLLACDVLERSLRLHGDPAILQPVVEVRGSLHDAAALGAIAGRMWDLVPYRGLYPNVSGEPTWESLPAWAAATVADPRFFSDVFRDAVHIAARATVEAARQAVLAAARQHNVPDAPQLAWEAALQLPERCGILPHPADAERARILGTPVEDWQKELESRAYEAERVWQNRYLASKL